MLDQNTDRMWYVIGAVLVGAAIILIANGTMPEIFASVTGSFEEVSNNASLGVNMASNRNLFDVSRSEQGYWVDSNTGDERIINDGELFTSSDYIVITGGSRYRLYSSGDGLFNPRITWFNGKKERIGGVYSPIDTELSALSPVDAKYARFSAMDASIDGSIDHAAIRNRPVSASSTWVFQKE